MPHTPPALHFEKKLVRELKLAPVHFKPLAPDNLAVIRISQAIDGGTRRDYRLSQERQNPLKPVIHLAKTGNRISHIVAVSAHELFQYHIFLQ
jgi:hypothetical protein